MRNSDDKDTVQQVTPHADGCGYALPSVEGEQSPKNEGVTYGSVLGCNAYTWPQIASCRTAICLYYAGDGASDYVGSWSIPFLTL